jgi:signal transduction histidine kinase
MTLIHCMQHDWLWIVITLVLDVAVAAGYVLIAWHWQANQRLLPPSPAKRALGNMRNIFVLCGICGYLFIPVKMVWPAWRLYDIFLVVLVYFTWRYAWGARDLKVVYSELGRARKLAADLDESRAESQRKSFFLNAISHDLRTPLNGLLLQTQVAEMSLDSGDPAAVRDALRVVNANAQAAARLLDNLLEVGRLQWAAEREHPEPIDLHGLLESIRQRFEPDAQAKGIELTLDESVAGEIVADHLKLERILTNLVSNAIKFTSVGGVTLGAEHAGDTTGIWIQDTGPGIADEHHDNLFQEFYQAANPERDRAKGFGLGLAIAERLAKQLGGTIEFHTALGRGTRFTLRLPARPGNPLAGAAGNGTGQATHPGG